MTTEAKIAANMANAQLSTGPRTDKGKAISSQNALKHGLTAKTVLIPGEDPAEYEKFSAGLVKGYDPLDAVEEALAIELIDLQWRLLRVPQFEARFLGAEPPDTKALNNLSLHAARTKRQYSATLKEFQQIHAANVRTRKAQLEEAELIFKADHINDRESTLARHGFDFTPQEIEALLRRKKARHEAWETVDDYEFELDDESEDVDDESDDELDDAA